MNEQFDRALRNHIRDTFDHYDDLLADDGWKKFKQQKNRKKRGLIFWYGLPTGIAAALAFYWIFNITATEVVKPEDKLLAKTGETRLPEKLNKGGETSVKTAERELKSEKNNFTPIAPQTDHSDLYQKDSYNAFASDKTVEETQPRIEEVNAQAKAFNAFEVAYSSPAVSLETSDLKSENIAKINQTDYLTFDNNLLDNASDYAGNTVANTKKEEDKKRKNFNIAIDANTFYSFTTAGVNNDLNMGVGVLSELKITKRLSISSGIALNRQTTHYEGNKDATASNSLAFQTDKKQPVSVPEMVQTSAKLVGFDIPINLKYNIPLGKTQTFVTTGVSSYSLLNQTYSNDLSVINYSITDAPTTTILRNVEEEKENAFSNFQFARTINFSFGVLYPVSKKNSISVEPFLKYPIAGFGSQDLEIGSGGISFKLNFGK